MKKISFRVRNFDNEQFLTFNIDNNAELDDDVLDFLEDEEPEGIVPVIFEEGEEFDTFSYEVTGKIQLRQLSEQEINAEMVLKVLRGLVLSMMNMSEYRIPLSYLVLNRQYIYIDSDYKVEFVCIPLEDMKDETDLSYFLRTFIASLRFDSSENGDYVAKILTYVNDEEMFNLHNLLDLIEEWMDRFGIEIPEGESNEIYGEYTEIEEEPEEDSVAAFFDNQDEDANKIIDEDTDAEADEDKVSEVNEDNSDESEAAEDVAEEEPEEEVAKEDEAANEEKEEPEDTDEPEVVEEESVEAEKDEEADAEVADEEEAEEEPEEEAADTEDAEKDDKSEDENEADDKADEAEEVKAEEAEDAKDEKEPEDESKESDDVTDTEEDNADADSEEDDGKDEDSEEDDNSSDGKKKKRKKAKADNKQAENAEEKKEKKPYFRTKEVDYSGVVIEDELDAFLAEQEQEEPPRRNFKIGKHVKINRASILQNTKEELEIAEAEEKAYIAKVRKEEEEAFLAKEEARNAEAEAKKAEEEAKKAVKKGETEDDKGADDKEPEKKETKSEPSLREQIKRIGGLFSLGKDDSSKNAPSDTDKKSDETSKDEEEKEEKEESKDSDAEDKSEDEKAEEDSAPVDPLINANPYLIRVNTEEKIMINKQTFKIGKSVVGADYTISGNGAISRIHAIITGKDGEYFIKDNKSTNHTFVNGESVEDGESVQLTDECKIVLGDEEFIFRLQ